MTKKEFIAVTKQWLKLHGFQLKGINNVYPFEKFNLNVLFYKDRFDKNYYIDVCRLLFER